MTSPIELTPPVYYSYSQFLVFDSAEELPGCAWTPAHTAQGFARRASTLNVATLSEYGFAQVRVHFCSSSTEDFTRVIAVPFLVVSGKVMVEGPEETEGRPAIELDPGNYRLTVAQRLLDDEKEAVELFFERRTAPVQSSEILVADDKLTPPRQLLEDCEVAS